MSKREANLFAAQGVDIDAPRAKRHKPGPATATASSPPKEERAASQGEQVDGRGSEQAKEDPEQVKERGLQLWQVIKDAANKEGRALSHDFLRLPSKRQYPDYYAQIKRPIALDDIKRQLDSGQYAFFDEVKQDFEQCFKNAKKYNMKESQIWKDAKHLHKLVLKESEKLTGIPEGGDGLADGDADAGSDAEGDEGKKKKGPNMYRLLKTRLQKLVSKADDEGRVLSTEFMELPNKRLWPSYYKVIKRPQCFENIFRRLKRKEYDTVSDFAHDVELVFSNALEFNQEHTQIWDDVLILRDYFRQLMSDLPTPFAMPVYASQDHSTKIKLKMPATQHASITGSTSQVTQSTAVQSPRLRVPALSSSTARSTPPVGAPAATTATTANPAAILAPPTGTSALSSVVDTVPQTSSVSEAAQSARAPYNQSTYSQHYPNALYQNSAPVTPAPTTYTSHHGGATSRAPIQPASGQASLQTLPLTIVTHAKSPTPPDSRNRRQLRYVSLVTKPFGRRLHMDYRDGVKTWAVRLGKGEISVRIGDVKLAHSAGDGEESDDEEGKGKEKEKEQERHEDDGDEEDEEVPQEKPKRGRGRPRKKVRAKTSESPKGKGKAAFQLQLPEEVQVRLNGAVMDPTETEKLAWDVDLQLGSNVLEVGEASGPAWRFYLERLAYS